jgi:hypothetical protein
MRHERRSSPYIWPAIVLFVSLASWLVDAPRDHDGVDPTVADAGNSPAASLVSDEG